MLRLVLLCSVVVGLLTVAGCGDGTRVPISDYDNGYNEGVNVVRESRQKMGELGTGAVMVGAEIRNAVGPIDESKNADWNAGARKGMWDEYNR
ncbi:MAG TPA: hypothetical protein PLF81_16660 [Candidatus Anammoximicrobium sp.]|nr:hypothetical protein [Candidatus Anammoximicrobium sp.]